MLSLHKVTRLTRGPVGAGRGLEKRLASRSPIIQDSHPERDFFLLLGDKSKRRQNRVIYQVINMCKSSIVQSRQEAKQTDGRPRRSSARTASTIQPWYNDERTATASPISNQAVRRFEVLIRVIFFPFFPFLPFPAVPASPSALALAAAATASAPFCRLICAA
jgi:hypothetical protein